MQFGGVFWQTFRGFANSANTLNQLLEKENTSIYEVLDDENVIQELKSMNQKLIEYLNEAKIHELVDLITLMPDEDVEHKRGHKYPFVVNELISCESWPVLNHFFTSPALLDRLFKYLDSSKPAPILDGYFSKLVSILVAKNPSHIFNFLESNNLLPSLVNHMGSKSISDLILKMILLEQVDMQMRKLILGHLLEILNSSEEVKVCYAAGVVIEIIGKLGEVPAVRELSLALGSGIWLRRLESLSSSSYGSNLAAGLDVLRSLIDSQLKEELFGVNKREEEMLSYDEDESEFVKVLINLIPGLVRRLERASEELPGTHKRALPLLGTDRLKIVDFLYSAAKSGNKGILNSFKQNQVFKVLTRMFFTFELNSILHNRYENFFTFIMDKFAHEEEVLIDLITSSGFLQLLDSNSNSIGQGGHILKLGTTLNRIKNRNSEFSKFLESSDEWKKFHQEVYTKKIKIEKKTLGETSSKFSDDLSSDELSHEKPAEAKDTIETLFEKTSYPAKDSESPEKSEENDSQPLNMQDLEPLNIKDLGPESSPKLESIGSRSNEPDEPAQQLEVSDSDYWRY